MGMDLLSLPYDEIAALVADMGYPAFRAKQLRGWVVKGTPVEEMRNLPRDFREKLIERGCHVTLPRIVRKLISQIDGTVKYLFALSDGQLIESVVMKYKHGNTICVSCQAGCRMGCRFCASTLRGLTRNLAPSEILGQVMAAQNDLGERIANIVMMGIGEPLDNYDNVVKFLRLVNDPEGLNISLRNISLSTCGLVPRMYDFAGEGLPVTLSLSLHAPNDEIRRQIMPVANAYSFEEVLATCKHYVEKTGRRVIFEYALIRNLNSDLRCADELARRLRGLRCHVNLIPLNDVKERKLEAPSRRDVDAFLKRLELKHISATIRREMGADIEGACGQLRRKVLSREQD